MAILIIASWLVLCLMVTGHSSWKAAELVADGGALEVNVLATSHREVGQKCKP